MPTPLSPVAALLASQALAIWTALVIYRAMSKASDNPADPFKKSLADATKALANDADMSVTYSVDPPGLTNDGARLPQVTRRMTRAEIDRARGTADAGALRRRFHNVSSHTR